MIRTFNIDCMEFMATIPTKHYDLAICDIPYGIGVGKMPYLKELKNMVMQKNGSRLNANRNKKGYDRKEWDEKVPTQQYFDELKRVSRHQIIFGIEYTDDWKGVGSGRIKWDKGFAKGVSFNRYETAYCSMIDHEVELPLLWAGMMQAKSLAHPMVQQGNKTLNEKRIHPTHKPVLLYKRLLMDYAKQGDKILDTHGGGMSIAIACHDMGFDLDVCELDEDYYNEARVRLLKHINSPKQVQLL